MGEVDGANTLDGFVAFKAETISSLINKLTAAEKERDGLRAALQITTPTARFEGRIGVAWTLLARIARHDWLDDPTEVRRTLDGFVEEARDLTINPGDDPTAEYVDSLTAAERARDSALSQLAEAKGENATLRRALTIIADYAPASTVQPVQLARDALRLPSPPPAEGEGK